MSRGIVFFNIIYYAVIFISIAKGKDDPSSSLGYGYFILAFWVIAAIVLVLLLAKKAIRPKSVVDKIGIFTATPVLSIAFITIILLLVEKVGSEWYFTKNNYRYKVVEYNYVQSLSVKRVEYYRSSDMLNSDGVLTTELWLKDSVWIYLSKTGDTMKRVRYNNDIEVR